jgi:hypothetical protein
MPSAGRAAAAPKLEIDSGYPARCAKLLAAAGLPPTVRGEQCEHHEKETWAVSVIAMGVLLLLVLATVWATIARRQARTATNTCDKDTVTASMMANAEKHMSGVELVWTERGERLHMSRECPALNSHLRGKAVCRLCARDNKLS